MTDLQAQFLIYSPKFDAIALEEYRQSIGKLFRCGYLCGYNGHDSDDVACDVIVRVAYTDLQSIIHWNNEWLDPYWDVELVHVISGKPPEGSYWIDGPSHNMLTGTRDWRNVEPISRLEYLKGRVFGFKKEVTN